MEKELKEEIMNEAGLVKWGENEDGETEWIGTDKQWAKADRLIQAQELSDQGEIK